MSKLSVVSVALMLMQCLMLSCQSFVIPETSHHHHFRHCRYCRSFQMTTTLNSNANDDNDTQDNDSNDSNKSNALSSLQEKQARWQATDEEVRASTLGGLVPPNIQKEGEERTDAFDVGLYVAFPLMIVASLAVVVFPFFLGDLAATLPPPPS